MIINQLSIGDAFSLVDYSFPCVQGISQEQMPLIVVSKTSPVCGYIYARDKNCIQYLIGPETMSVQFVSRPE